MITEQNIIDHLPVFRKQITKDRNILRKQGLITADEEKEMNYIARRLLKKSTSPLFFTYLSLIFEHVGIDDLNDVELYDFLVLSAVFKNPGGFFGMSKGSLSALNCINNTFDTWGDLRKITYVLNEIAELDSRPHMAIREWKSFAKISKDLDFINGQISVLMALNTIITRERIPKNCIYDMNPIKPLLRKSIV